MLLRIVYLVTMICESGSSAVWRVTLQRCISACSGSGTGWETAIDPVKYFRVSGGFTGHSKQA